MSDGKPALPVLNLTIVYRPTNSIKPESRNARTHSKKQIAGIAASIQQFGFANPLLIDVDGVLIAGHGRLLAAKSIGLDLAPTITLPHLDESQRRALRLADNKIALNAGWDVDLLKLELKELADLEIGFDLSVTGFSTGEIDVLLSSEGDPDDETIPAVPAQPRTRLGDIWICGQHRVGCGDGRDLTSTSFARSLATKLRSMRPSWIRPTTSESAATRTRRGGIANSLWLPER
jgi:ParB-like nuclease domain